MNKLNINLYILLILTILIAYICTLPIDLIDIDTAQYGEVTREMVKTNDFLHLKDNGKKFLDKPILTFWTISFFFKVFGISNYSYRIPAILTLCISLWGIYKLSILKFNNKEIALLSALIYLSIPGTYTFVLNPTIDIYLNTYLILIHLFYYYGFKKNRNYFYLMYLFMGMGIITKGPIALVIPCISIGGDILFRRDWKRMMEMKILPGILITSILPLFWSYILYQDFGDFGPYFYLYQQSFGRFYMKRYNQGWNPLYFSLTFSWMFLPFMILLVHYVVSIIRFNKSELRLVNLNQKYASKIFENAKSGDYVIEFWLFLYLFLISFSKYRMPQYSFWNIPSAVIFIAPYLNSIIENKKINRNTILLFFPSLMSVLFIILIPIYIINISYTYILIIIIYLLLLIILMKYEKYILSLVFLPLGCAFIMTSILIYPEMVKYQPSSKLGATIKKMEPKMESILSFGIPRSKRSYEFYSDRLMVFELNKQNLEKLIQKDKERLALVTDEFLFILPAILGEKIKYKIIESYPVYKIATPKKEFFNKFKRNKITKRVYLIQLYGV
jgi:4-amino-4-deoxy-L-arabinose transferase-like glycosyltransferase